MHIDWWTLGLQTINLLVLVWILSRFLFRPIAGIIRQRQSAADELLKKAEAERHQADEEEKEAEKDKEEAEKARGSVLQSAAKEAETEKGQILADARKEADKLRADAKAEIAKLRKSEEERNSKLASELAVEIAARLFERLPAGAQIDGFIGGLAEAVGKLPERSRAEIGAAGTPVSLKAARKMSASEVKACEAALSKALDREVTIDAKMDPALIAGIELEAPHATIRNSFRADLERIASKLQGDGEA